MKDIKIIVDGKEIQAQVSEEQLKQLCEKKTGYERVKKGGVFYYVSGYGYAETNDACDRAIDSRMYNIANYYSDETVAKNNARADKLMCQLRRFAVENRGGKPDWSGYGSNWFIAYSHYNKEFDVVVNCNLQFFGGIYFDSDETAQKAINQFKDELIWYFTEYKDSL